MATIFGPKKPKTLMIAGSILCVLAFSEIFIDYPPWTGLWGIVVGLYIIYLGYRKRRQDRIGGGATEIVSTQAIARRKLVLYVSVNLGIVIAVGTMYRSVPPWIVILSGAISFIFFNGMVFFMFRHMVTLQKSRTEI